MGWARLDDSFHDHPKVDGLSLAAVGLYTLCLTWANRHRKTAIVPGHITDARVAKLAGKDARRLTTELVTAGLWEVEPVLGGWVIHDFTDYLPKERDPDERKEAAKRGAAKRWQKASQGDANPHGNSNGKPDGNLPSTDVANDASRASAPASPSRPDPITTSELTSGEQRSVTYPPATATQHPPDDDPTQARCTAHTNIATPPPCLGCKNARERAEAVIDRDRDQAEREHRIAAEQAARTCDQCDGVWIVDDNRNPTRRRCDHRRTA